MHIKKLTAAILAFSFLFTACSSEPDSDSPSQSAAADTLGYATEMNKDAIMTFEITVDPDKWQNMLDNATDEEYISADITINGTTVNNVGIRPKGNSSLSSIARDDTSDRYSFKLNFDKYVDDQTWLGLDKLVLNSNYSDATSMKEYLSYDIMNYIGVDTVLYAYASITVNSESWGFYLAVEDYEDSYLTRSKNSAGELYKPENTGLNMGGGDREWNNEEGRQPVRPHGAQGFARPEGIGGDGEGFVAPEGFAPGEGGNFEPPEMGEGLGSGMRGDNGVALIYTDEQVSSYASIFDNAKTKTNEEDHQRVIEAIKNLNEGANLETYVDVEAILRYLAAHTVVVNLDSYSSGLAHNYILYENEGRISMLPWDYNMAFGGFQSRDASRVVNFPIDTPVSGVSMEDRPMISKLLEVPEYLKIYHQYLQEITDGYFAGGKFAQKADQLDGMIATYIESDPSAFYTYEEYKTAIAELKKLANLRAESIQGQLDGTIPATTEGQTAEPDKLIDASSVDLTWLGGMGGGNRDGGFGGTRGNGQGLGIWLETERE